MKIYHKCLGGVLAAIASIAPCPAATVMMSTPPNFQILSMSPNGKWACGVFLDLNAEPHGFRWNLESGSITVLGGEMNMAYDVANNGTVSGDFNDYTYMGNGAALDLPGFWRNGSWHHMQMPEGMVTDGMGYGISPDGKYMTGSVCVDNRYTPYIWHEGLISRDLGTDNHAVGMAVSPDGQAAAGFNTRYNRTAAIWRADGTLVHFDDSPISPETPWSYARNFSPDGKKLVYWGGWELDEEDNLYLWCIYDVETGERFKVKASSYESTVEYYDISNNSMLVGSENGRGYVMVDGEGMFIDEFFEMKGIDFSNFDDIVLDDTGIDFLPIDVVVAVSEDENVLAMRYYDKNGQYKSLVVKMNQDESTIGPAEFTAEQLPGINSVVLKWHRPQGNAAIRGYNVYRDGKKLNGVLPLNVPYFYDNNLAEGTYTYRVAAMTTTGVEISAESIELTVTPRALEAPHSAAARQKGVNNAYLTWQPPMSDIIHKHYFSSYDQVRKPFYIYDAMEIELAIAYDKDEMKAYRGNKITEVSFVPLAEQIDWFVNLYTRDSNGDLKLLYNQYVEQTLELNAINTVQLDTPVDIPDGELIVAIECHTDGIKSETLGTDNSRVVVGKSDLLRMISDDDFFSVYESALESGNFSCSCWAIDFGITPDGSTAVAPVTYEIYSEGALVGTTSENEYIVEQLADGPTSFEIVAVYPDGTSAPAVASVEIKSKYPSVAVDAVEIENAKIKATWSAPVDNDLTDFSYAKSTSAANGIITNRDYFLAAIDYPANSFSTYAGYKINSFRFYPMTEADYIFQVYDDENMIYEQEVYNYTLNTLNDIPAVDDVFFEKGHNYRIAIQCSNYDPEAKLLGLDNYPAKEFVTDLYSLDGYMWNSVSADVGINGNWLMGITLASSAPSEIAVDGYDVVIDGRKANSSAVTGTEYEYSFGSLDKLRHTLRVDTHYPLRSEVVKGSVTFFYLSQSGITDAIEGYIKLNQGENYLVAEGEGVNSIEIFDVTGKKAAACQGNKVEIGHLPAGVYVVRVNAAGKFITSKIRIAK